MAHLVVGAIAVGFAWVPLFGTLGFEFAAAMGAALAYTSGWLACCAASAARAGSGGAPQAFPGRAFLRAGSANLSLLATPLAVIALHSLRVPTCNWSQGLAFYLLLPLPGVLYGTCLGFALGLAHPARRATGAFFLWSLATYAWALWFMLEQPPKFAFNSFIGYFPGPIYDAEVPITGTLVLARGITVAQAVVLALAALLAWDGDRQRARAGMLLRAWRGERAVAGGVALMVLACLGGLAARAAPLGLRPDRRFIQRTLGGRIETRHFHIYYDRSVLSDSRVAELAAEHEFRYVQLRDFFQLEPRRKIGSYVYGSPAQKKRLMGAAGTSFEDAWNDEFHINAADYPHPMLMHEMAHIFAAYFDRRVPVSPKIGLHEGLAVAAEWSVESGRLGLTPDEACAAMDSLGLLPDLGRTLDAFGFWTQSGARAYTAAGSFVHFLIDRGGMPRFRVLWPWGDFEKAYGESLPALVQDWRARLRRVASSPEKLRRARRLFAAPGIFAVPCAHEQARLETEAEAAFASGRNVEAESLYTRLRAIDTDNPEFDLDRARARLQRGDARGALLLGRQVLDEPGGTARRGEAWRLCGDAAWQLDRLAEAESCYAAGRRESAFESEQRGFEVSLLAMRDAALRPLLRDYLTASHLSESAGLALLAEARVADPSSRLPRYLLGRRLYYAESFETAALELRAALEPGGSLSDAILGGLARRAAVDLLGRSELRLGRPAEARQAFETLLGMDLEPAERLHVEDWQARCVWKLERGRLEGAANRP